MRPVLVGLLMKPTKTKLNNLKIIKEDAVDKYFNNHIPDDSLSKFQLFFPDPWHKKRHHKRRIIQTSFLDITYKKAEKQVALSI